MIMRAMALGFVLWLANAAIFRFAGQYFFFDPFYALFAIVAAIGAAITFASVKLLRCAPGDEAEAAISVAMPSLVLNAFLTYKFAEVFPGPIDEANDAIYGALAMIYAGAMVFTGLLMTRIAPQDERV
jgi:Family of unknown function (DUF5367)